MEEFIYTKYERFNSATYIKLKFIRETPTQIVAQRPDNNFAIYKFNKETRREVGCHNGDSLMITKEAYIIGRNKQIDAKIALKEKEISALNEDINKLKAMKE